MRIAVILMILGILQARANDAYSQKTILSLNFSETELVQVLDKIEVESEFFFLFNEKLLDTDRKVSITANDQLISVILDDLFKGTDVKYTIIDRKIILAPDYLTSEPQQNRITGTVIEKDGAPLPGVNVVVTGTTQGTMTDIAGKYSINVPPGAMSLTFSFVGMVSQEISIGTLTQINVTLAESAIGLDEVVVIGYGTARKATITGSVSTVSGEKLAVANTTNFTNTLVGRLPGLVAVTNSGLPGADDATLRIRGNNTLNNNNPLIVVDGIANRIMSRLDAADIESVIILKDASAAIYGAQAANGVILITTKRGAIGALKVNATFNQGFSAPTVLPDMADSYLYATMMNEVDTYAGQKPRFTDDDLQKYKDGSDPWGHPNTDWFKEVFKPFSLENYANINFSGGTENLKYFVSIGTKYQDATYRKSGSNYMQVDFRSNIDAKVSDNINFSIDLAGRQENRKNPISGLGSAFRIIPRGKPTDVAWWFNGLPGPDVESDLNPVVVVSDIPGYDDDKRYIMESNLKLNINIPWVKGLSVTGNASIDKNFQNRKNWQVPFKLYVWDKLTYDDDGLPLLSGSTRGVKQPQLSQYMGDGQRVTLNGLINYERRMADKHMIKILVGSESSNEEAMNFTANRKYFVSGSIPQLFAGGDLEKDNSGSASQSARLNYFGRINYDYLSKYLMEFVWRYDGSYKFPADKRWGFFPGFSLGWLISEENFLKNNLAFLNYFKIRGSWGQTGNDRIDEFQYLASYAFSTNIRNDVVFNLNEINKTLREQSIPNVNVTWEIANQTDIGFDAQMLNGKLKLEADYFYNLRSKILIRKSASIPASAGLTLPPENIGKVQNQGFEFMVSYGDKSGVFSYNVSVNGGYAKNKILFWDETPGVPEYQKTTGYPMNTEGSYGTGTGVTINTGLYYQAIGIFRDQAAVDDYPHWIGARPGDIIFKDVNEDGKIDGLDQVRGYKGNIPTFTGGLNIDLTYKNFFATVLFQGVFGTARYLFNESGEAGNYHMEDAVGRWTEDNPDASKPRAYSYVGEYWRAQNNTFYLYNSDYVRLKNIKIGYVIPKSIISKLGIDDFRIYVGGVNLITWTKLPDWDPESIFRNFPLSKTFNVGATITF